MVKLINKEVINIIKRIKTQEEIKHNTPYLAIYRFEQHNRPYINQGILIKGYYYDYRWLLPNEDLNLSITDYKFLIAIFDRSITDDEILEIMSDLKGGTYQYIEYSDIDKYCIE